MLYLSEVEMVSVCGADASQPDAVPPGSLRGGASTLRLGANGWRKVKGAVLAAQCGPRCRAEDLPFSSPATVLKFRVFPRPGFVEKNGEKMGRST